MTFITFALIGFGLIYIGRALSEISNLLYLLASELDNDKGDGGEHDLEPVPTEPGPPSLLTMDEVLRVD